MKYLKEGVVIFGISLVGELLNLLLPLPVPAGVYGLFLLLVLLCSGVLKLASVENTGNFLLDIMPVLFIPASVGVIENVEIMRAILLPVLVISIVSTVIVMIVTGKVTELMLNRSRKGSGETQEQTGKKGGRS